METNYYSFNMQKLLQIAEQLHCRGYEHLKALPFAAPNGLAWRCMFYNGTHTHEELPVSNWLSHKFPTLHETIIETSISELTTVFEQDNEQFLNDCRGEDTEYKNWFSEMLKVLEPDELPIAFADYTAPTTYWRTTHQNKIPLLQTEIDHLKRF
ncbi:hypothetical protein [Kaistella carnis]|uniref:Uncharacterized protein n=1 Tax=Kaistella carnis TaxID=1241979 RepID=A0A3G8XYZ8_9FLAO|nr:hypothetical protein [Kaistella carnis]AZI33961.1 hypothetical protein EIB73_12530 [Kaistella carnis]